MLKQGTFKWAEKLMKKGIFMRRKNWTGYVMAIEGTKPKVVYITFTSTNSFDGVFYDPDLSADDWEVALGFNLGDL